MEESKLVDMTIGLWVSEYSPSQDAYHVETVRELIQRNKKFIRNHIEEKRYFPDYLVVGVHTSHDSASQAIDRLYRPYIEECKNTASNSKKS